MWIRILEILTLLLAAQNILDLSDDLPYFLELSTHFKAQYALCSLLLALYFLVVNRRLFLWIGLLTFFLHVFSFLPWSFSSPQVEHQGLPFRALLFNVLYDNQQTSMVLEEMKHNSPDLIGVVELSPGWKTALDSLSGEFPYQHLIVREDGFGLGLYSRYPLKDSEILYLGGAGNPTLATNLIFQSGTVHIVLAHALPPTSLRNFHLRNQHLKELGTHLKSISSPKLLLGDLNVTMFSPEYRNLENRTGMTNARQGFGLVPTWPASNPILAIPIDHILLDQQSKIHHFQSGTSVGSDHLPIFAEIRILPRLE